MSKSEKKLAVGSEERGGVGGESRRVFYCLLLTAYCLLSLGCRQDMQDQPRYEAYEAISSFKDGLSSRSLVEGTVPRGYLRADKQLFTGQKAQGNANTQAQGAAAATTTGNANAQAGGAN